ncbi:MAG: molybdopterin-dependent oxidoreductase [Sterolibacterium sp.]
METKDKKEQSGYWNWDAATWGTHRVNCYPGSCSYQVYAKDGKVTREEVACNYPEFDDPDHRVPDFNPRGCQKGCNHSQAMYGPDRLLYPMKRAGERGSGKWDRITWDQAFDEIGGKLAQIIVEDGARALICDTGSNGVGNTRGSSEISALALAGILGGTLFDLDCIAGDFNIGQYLTFGQIHAHPGIEGWFLADTIIITGANPVYANIPDFHYVLEARYKGSKVIAVCPDKSPTAQFVDEWVPVDYSADPAVWMGVCRLLIERGWIDEPFMKEQTDLPLAVRTDTKRFLREADLKAGGGDMVFYAMDAATGKPRGVPMDTLRMPFEYDLKGSCDVKLADGSTVKVTTVYNMLKERIAEYTPERVREMSGIHPEQVERLAELCRPPRKVFVFVNFNAGKTYHGDLLERAYCYMLALTGNIGKPGTGTKSHGWGTEILVSTGLVSGMPKDILESEDTLGDALTFLQKTVEDYRDRVKMDPTMPPVEAVYGAYTMMLKGAGTLSPPAYYWLNHCGYKDVWDKQLDDPLAPHKISEYADKAAAAGWYDGQMNPPADQKLRACFVSGSNPLRRYRGRTFFETMWPKLDLVVVADTRRSTTGLWADYMLPAASHYEYADCKPSSTQTRFTHFTDQAVPMLGESKSDRMIVLGILQKVEEHLKRRGVKTYKVGDREVVVDEIYWRATMGGKYGTTDAEEERLFDDGMKALSSVGWMENLDRTGEEITLETMRRDGMSWMSGRSAWHMAAALNSDLTPGEVLYPYRDQVEQKIPYKSTTRRIQFLVDHPWFVEADEHLVRYKQPPNIGGKQGMRLTSGHLRWSIHAMWVASAAMLKLHRGEPFCFLNNTAAAAKGVADGDFVRVFNDYDSFTVRAKLSSTVRPDQLVIYHAWEPYQYPDWKSYDTLLPGPPKGLQFAGGYRHFEFTLFNWAPYQSDRQTNVTFELAQPVPGA